MHPFYTSYLQVFKALLDDIRKTITGLPPAALDWNIGPDSNSLNVLVTHTVGSTRYWIGDVAAGEPSNRERSAEFGVHGLNEAQLLELLQVLETYVEQTLARFTLEQLQELRHPPDRDRAFTVAWALLHALEHVALHTGHMQLMRQHWDGHQPA